MPRKRWSVAVLVGVIALTGCANKASTSGSAPAGAIPAAEQSTVPAPAQKPE